MILCGGYIYADSKQKQSYVRQIADQMSGLDPFVWRTIEISLLLLLMPSCSSRFGINFYNPLPNQEGFLGNSSSTKLTLSPQSDSHLSMPGSNLILQATQQSTCSLDSRLLVLLWEDMAGFGQLYLFALNGLRAALLTNRQLVFSRPPQEGAHWHLETGLYRMFALSSCQRLFWENSSQFNNRMNLSFFSEDVGLWGWALIPQYHGETAVSVNRYLANYLYVNPVYVPSSTGVQGDGGAIRVISSPSSPRDCADGVLKSSAWLDYPKVGAGPRGKPSKIEEPASSLMAAMKRGKFDLRGAFGGSDVFIIGVHIRRGDACSRRHVNNGRPPCWNDEKFISSMERAVESTRQLRQGKLLKFYIASDDVSALHTIPCLWAKNFTRPEADFAFLELNRTKYEILAGKNVNIENHGMGDVISIEFFRDFITEVSVLAQSDFLIGDFYSAFLNLAWVMSDAIGYFSVDNSFPCLRGGCPNPHGSSTTWCRGPWSWMTTNMMNHNFFSFDLRDQRWLAAVHELQDCGAHTKFEDYSPVCILELRS